MKESVERFKDMDALSERAAKLVLETAIAAVEEHGAFSFAFSGGNSPRALLALLASPPWIGRMPWRETHLFQVDERFIPHDSPLNNFRAASELLLSKAPVPDGNVRRIRTDAGSPELASEGYERELKGFFGDGSAFPRFDLVQLGMGDDGHTASLFPGSKLLGEESRWVLAAPAPTTAKPEVPRVTLTLPAINSARKAFFIVQGAAKAELLESFRGKSGAETLRSLPASGVKPQEELIWLLCP